MSRPTRQLAALPFLEPPPIPSLRDISPCSRPSGLKPQPISLLRRIEQGQSHGASTWTSATTALLLRRRLAFRSWLPVAQLVLREGDA